MESPNQPAESGQVFNIHPDAIKAFAEQANDIAARVVVRMPEPQRKTGWKAEIHSAFHLTNEHLSGPVQMSETDIYGNETARYRETPTGVYGLRDESFANLTGLAMKIQNQKCWRDVVSVKFVQDALFDWCLDKTCGVTVSVGLKVVSPRPSGAAGASPATDCTAPAHSSRDGCVRASRRIR